MRDRSIALLKAGGILVSVVSADSPPTRSDVRTVFFYVEVTSERLETFQNCLTKENCRPCRQRASSARSSHRPSNARRRTP